MKNAEQYKVNLEAIRINLRSRIESKVAAAKEQPEISSDGRADSAIADEIIGTEFDLADSDTTMLQRVEAALTRIEQKIFGFCAVDGRPIEAKRLEARPWATLCLYHQEIEDDRSGARIFSL